MTSTFQPFPLPLIQTKPSRSYSPAFDVSVKVNESLSTGIASPHDLADRIKVPVLLHLSNRGLQIRQQELNHPEASVLMAVQVDRAHRERIAG